jgi:hypothetical protein
MRTNARAAWLVAVLATAAAVAAGCAKKSGNGGGSPTATGSPTGSPAGACSGQQKPATFTMTLLQQGTVVDTSESFVCATAIPDATPSEVVGITFSGNNSMVVLTVNDSLGASAVPIGQGAIDIVYYPSGGGVVYASQCAPLGNASDGSIVLTSTNPLAGSFSAHSLCNGSDDVEYSGVSGTFSLQ